MYPPPHGTGRNAAHRRGLEFTNQSGSRRLLLHTIMRIASTAAAAAAAAVIIVYFEVYQEVLFGYHTSS